MKLVLVVTSGDGGDSGDVDAMATISTALVVRSGRRCEDRNDGGGVLPVLNPFPNLVNCATGKG